MLFSCLWHSVQARVRIALTRTTLCRVHCCQIQCGVLQGVAVRRVAVWRGAAQSDVEQYVSMQSCAALCDVLLRCASTSSTSAKVYAPPLQLQFPSPKRNKAHECRCELILEMKVSAMSMTITVTACDVWTGIASGHLLGSMPEAAECIIASNRIASSF